MVAAPSDEAPAPADKAPTAGRVSSGRVARGRVRSSRVPLANVLPLRCACPLEKHRIPEARVELQQEQLIACNPCFQLCGSYYSCCLRSRIHTVLAHRAGHRRDTGEAHCIERQKARGEREMRNPPNSPNAQNPAKITIFDVPSGEPGLGG